MPTGVGCAEQSVRVTESAGSSPSLSAQDKG